ncbi:Lrp/AsnC family transcriptional regulator [Candidatus Bathyarchaeota archaeon]|nr:Lrp/AsnC family transcriptional regulator [Candidatus Bathyarchaeota archaeon]
MDNRIDEKDLKILRELLTDARLSYREIARRVNLSVATVKARVEKLQRLGVIKGYTVILDPDKLGYDVSAVVEIMISKGRLREVEEQLAKNPHVYAVYDVTGTCDAMILARFRNRGELSKFVKSMLAMDYVERTITHLILRVVKEDPRVYI